MSFEETAKDCWSIEQYWNLRNAITIIDDSEEPREGDVVRVETRYCQRPYLKITSVEVAGRLYACSGQSFDRSAIKEIIQRNGKPVVYKSQLEGKT